MYIIRSQESDELDGALVLLKSDGCRKQSDGKCGMVFIAFVYSSINILWLVREQKIKFSVLFLRC